MWLAIQAATWASIWAAISAISTTLTVIVAGWAMFRWRKQDELKAKMAFKKAISDYSWCLAGMPEVMRQKGIVILPNKPVDDLNQFFFACMNTWQLTEGLLEKNKRVHESWLAIAENHNHYLSGDYRGNDILEKCRVILDEKFVFK